MKSEKGKGVVTMRKLRIQRISGLVLGLLLAATAVVLCLFFLGGETPEGQRLLPELSQSEPAQTDALLVWMYVLFGLALLVTLGGVTYKFVARCILSPRSALRSLSGMALLAVVLGVSWCAGSDRPLDMPGYDGTENVAFWLKAADMFLYAIYILLGIAAALALGFGIARRFR